MTLIFKFKIIYVPCEYKIKIRIKYWGRGMTATPPKNKNKLQAGGMDHIFNESF